MAFNVAITSTYNDGSGPLTGTITTSAPNVAGAIIPATLSATVKQDFAYVASKVVSVYLCLSGMQAGDQVTFTTYAELQGSQGSALDTITLTNGVPFVWCTGMGTNPLQTATGVLSVKCVNGVARTGQIDFRVGYSAT